MIGATAYAVHAHQALRLPPWRAADGIVAALAMEQAAVAVVARLRILVESQQRPLRHRAQQRAQRANRTAPEARDAQTHRENHEEQNAQKNSLRKMRLPEFQNH